MNYGNKTKPKYPGFARICSSLYLLHILQDEPRPKIIYYLSLGLDPPPETGGGGAAFFFRRSGAEGVELSIGSLLLLLLGAGTGAGIFTPVIVLPGA